jgi:hypothetical protein
MRYSFNDTGVNITTPTIITENALSASEAFHSSSLINSDSTFALYYIDGNIPNRNVSTMTQEYQKIFTCSCQKATTPITVSIKDQILTRQFSPTELPFEAYGHANTHTTDALYMKTFNVLAPEDHIYPFTRERVRRTQDYQTTRNKDNAQRSKMHLDRLHREADMLKQSRESVKSYRRINASDIAIETQKTVPQEPKIYVVRC